MNEANGIEAIIFALGCVGYTRPDLVEDLIPFLERASAGFGSLFAVSASFTALKKIGMETGCLLDYALKGKRTVSDTMEILYNRMREYGGHLVDKSIEAIEALAGAHLHETVKCLNEQLGEVRRTSKWAGYLEQNIVIAIEKLSKRLSDEMKETVPLLLEYFVRAPFPWYPILDHSAMALRNIFEKHPELIPMNIEQELNSFLQNESRMSVVQNTKELLNEIKKHKGC